jgi:hypothetical protein
LCETCALRYEQRERCPECDEPLIDLTDAGARNAALSRMRRETLGSRTVARITPGTGCRVAVIVGGIIVLTFAGMVSGAVLAGGVGWMLGFFLVPVVLTLAWALWFPTVHLAPERARTKTVPVPIGVSEPPVIEPSGRRDRVRGRILEVPELLCSPLAAERCVAYRLAGRVGRTAIDEAAAMPFVLETESELVEIDPRPATILLELPALRRVAPVTPQLAELLRRCGATPESDEVLLAEARVMVGDEITVEGSVHSASRAAGYRGKRSVRLFRERQGSPLVLDES